MKGHEIDPTDKSDIERIDGLVTTIEIIGRERLDRLIDLADGEYEFASLTSDELPSPCSDVTILTTGDRYTAAFETSIWIRVQHDIDKDDLTTVIYNSLIDAGLQTSSYSTYRADEKSDDMALIFGRDHTIVVHTEPQTTHTDVLIKTATAPPIQYNSYRHITSGHSNYQRFHDCLMIWSLVMDITADSTACPQDITLFPPSLTPKDNYDGYDGSLLPAAKERLEIILDCLIRPYMAKEAAFPFAIFEDGNVDSLPLPFSMDIDTAELVKQSAGLSEDSLHELITTIIDDAKWREPVTQEMILACIENWKG